MPHLPHKLLPSGDSTLHAGHCKRPAPSHNFHQFSASSAGRKITQRALGCFRLSVFLDLTAVPPQGPFSCRSSRWYPQLLTSLALPGRISVSRQIRQSRVQGACPTRRRRVGFMPTFDRSGCRRCRSTTPCLPAMAARSLRVQHAPRPTGWRLKAVTHADSCAATTWGDVLAAHACNGDQRHTGPQQSPSIAVVITCHSFKLGKRFREACDPRGGRRWPREKCSTTWDRRSAAHPTYGLTPSIAMSRNLTYCSPLL
jgi:hypothetical protein